MHFMHGRSAGKGKVYPLKKAIDISLSLIGRVIFIGLSAQIVLGILWAFGAMPGFQQFQESFFYLAVSEKLVWDEYTGILYPLILRFLRGVCSILPFSYTYFLYPLQLLAAFFAIAYFIKSAWRAKGFWKVWGTLALLSFPVALQCHMAVLPVSFAGSCFWVQLASFWKVQKGEKGDILKACIMQALFFVVGALLLPEYVLFGGVVGILLVIYCLKKKVYVTSLIYLVAVVLAVGINCLVQNPGSWGRMHRSPESILFERVAFTHLDDPLMLQIGEMEEIASDYDFSRLCYYALDRREKLGPYLEQKFGVENAKKKYGRIAEAYFLCLKREVLFQIRWDAIGYFLPPIATKFILNGSGYYSYTAKNYDAFLGRMPKFSDFYFNYYIGWFVVGSILIGLTLVLSIARLCLKQGFPRKLKNTFPYVACVISGLIMPLWYTMQAAGSYDYKNVYVYLSLWYLGTVGLCIWSFGKEKEGLTK